MKKFADQSKKGSVKLQKKIKKASVCVAAFAVALSSIAAFSTSDMATSSQSKSISLAAAGNTLDKVDAPAALDDSMRYAEVKLSGINKTGDDTSALASTNKKMVISAVSGEVVEITEAPTTQAPTTEATTEATTEMIITDEDKSASGLPDVEVSENPSTEKSTEGLPQEELKYVDGEVNGVYVGNFLITAYCPCPICCGQWSNMVNPVTADGCPAVEGESIAAPPEFPFGTKLIFDGHVYTVHDRGGAIKGNRIDVYFSTHEKALKFAMGYYDVYMQY